MAVNGDELTTTEAAAYTGLARQTIVAAAKRGELGRVEKVRGTSTGYIYFYTKAELDAWVARPRKSKGGRPKGTKNKPKS